MVLACFGYCKGATTKRSRTAKARREEEVQGDCRFRALDIMARLSLLVYMDIHCRLAYSETTCRRSNVPKTSVYKLAFGECRVDTKTVKSLSTWDLIQVPGSWPNLMGSGWYEVGHFLRPCRSQTEMNWSSVTNGDVSSWHSDRHCYGTPGSHALLAPRLWEQDRMRREEDGSMQTTPWFWRVNSAGSKWFKRCLIN